VNHPHLQIWRRSAISNHRFSYPSVWSCERLVFDVTNSPSPLKKQMTGRFRVMCQTCPGRMAVGARHRLFFRSSISTPSLSRTPILQTYIEESRSYPVRIPGGPASDVSTTIYTHVVNRGGDRFLSRSGILRFRRPVYKGMSRSQKSVTRH